MSKAFPFSFPKTSPDGSNVSLTSSSSSPLATAAASTEANASRASAETPGAPRNASIKRGCARNQRSAHNRAGGEARTSATTTSRCRRSDSASEARSGCSARALFRCARHKNSKANRTPSVARAARASRGDAPRRREFSPCVSVGSPSSVSSERFSSRGAPRALRRRRASPLARARARLSWRGSPRRRSTRASSCGRRRARRRARRGVRAKTSLFSLFPRGCHQRAHWPSRSPVEVRRGRRSRWTRTRNADSSPSPRAAPARASPGSRGAGEPAPGEKAFPSHPPRDVDFRAPPLLRRCRSLVRSFDAFVKQHVRAVGPVEALAAGARERLVLLLAVDGAQRRGVHLVGPPERVRLQVGDVVRLDASVVERVPPGPRVRLVAEIDGDPGTRERSRMYE